MFTKFSKQFHSIGQKIALPYIVFFELVLICRMVSVYSTLPPKIDSIFSMIIMLLSGIIFLSHFLPMILEKKKIKIAESAFFDNVMIRFKILNCF